MKGITEKTLRKLLKTNNGAAKLTIQLLLDNCMEEIDTLTVSKLRPMCDAPKDSQWFLGYYVGVCAEYFELLRYSKLSGKLRSIGDEFNEEDVLGWIPMPIYKPELTGDGEKTAG